jgi:hypothetical protein
MSRIVKIEIGRLDHAGAGEFKFFKPSPDGQVTRPSVLVRLTDENGVERPGANGGAIVINLPTLS